MNVLIIIVAGVSAGWATQKLYHVFFTSKKRNEGKEEETTSDEKKKTTKKETKKQVKKTKKKIKKEESSQVKSDHVDDLSQLKGVGPKLSEALEEIGIYNYEQLSEPSIELLLTRLRETGGRFSRPAITAIIERAKLAAKER